MASLTEKELSLKVRQRSTIRGLVTKELQKIDPLFAQIPAEPEGAKIISEKIRDYQERLKNLDEIIQENVADEKLDDELQRSESYRAEIIAGLTCIQSRLEALLSAPAETPSAASPGMSKELTPKLPQLEIPKYGGDPLLWDEFWDNYSSSIHERQDLPTIDKFKYLKSFLEGDALRMADGYRLTVANYDGVVNALRERFGDPEIATFSHFDALISLKPASYQLSELRGVLDKCESHIRSLVALGLDESTFGVVFTPLILSKLPKGVKIEMHRKNGSHPWRLANLRTLLKEEICAREKGEWVFASAGEKPATTAPTSPKHCPKSATSTNPNRRLVTSSALASPAQHDTKQRTSPVCAFCTGSHYSSACRSYGDLESRLRRVQGRCHVCLREGHRAPQCRAKRPCYFCKRNTHHQSLCRSQFTAHSDSRNATTPTDTSGASSHVSEHKPESNLSLQTPGSKSVLQTALAKIKGSENEITARLYFDTGGSRSFITKAAAKKIGATYVGKETVSVGRFRDDKRSSISYDIFEFQICLANGDSKTVRMSAEATISCPIQLIPLGLECSILSQVKLAEPLVKTPTMVKIDVLIGNDYYYDLVGPEQTRCSNGIVLLSSPFGFIAGGLLTKASQAHQYESSMFIHANTKPDLSHAVERFWSLEEIGIKDDGQQNDDESALQMFNESVQFVKDRYAVQWPWKNPKPELPDNFGLAKGRLKSLLHRIQENDTLLDAYDQTVKDQQKKGIIESAPEIPEGVTHYLPHHCVVSPSKKTTKVRIVYDASAKISTRELSLNECLHRGPVFLANSVGIILRWRLPQIAMVSDIEKAFLQVALQHSERDVTRFLWLKDVREPISKANLQVFRFCRVPFGVISSPFLLAATVAHHLKRIGSAVAETISKNIYVDNIFGAAATNEGAIRYYKEAKQIFSGASMNLREWYSNSSSFLNAINPEDRGEGQVTSILGLKWDLLHDHFQIPCTKLPDCCILWTKRDVLQAIASVFDPCGLLSPLTIQGKLLMQELWKKKIGWDDPLPSEVQQLWKSTFPNLAGIATIAIPRRLRQFAEEFDGQFQLHCFCDASSKAYAATIYLVSTTNSFHRSDLIFAKARVAPVKSLTIPRLELTAVLIGTRLLRFAEEQLRLTIKTKYLWTDSSCVLHWIFKKPVSTVFVQNRLREIQSVNNLQFRFVPSSDNPADMPSRGVNVHDLKAFSLWWHGPRWLSQDSSTWPAHIIPSRIETSTELHISSQSFQTSVQTAKYAKEPIFDLGRVSSMHKLFRITSYVFRFIAATRRELTSPTLIISAPEIESAKLYWLKVIQSTNLPIADGPKESKADNHLRRQLNPFQDPDGIIRCKGRYLSVQSKTQSYPVLIPKNPTFTDLIIRDCHERLIHAGVKHTLAQLRQEYWVIHARNQVKRVIKNCNLCRVYHGGSFRTPPAASLPDCRITVQKPFQVVGIDYLGPLFLTDHSSTDINKVWVCLFTCATIRAVHLEVVDSLSTEQFLLSFRRFIASCGRAQLIISDNAKQFHSAERVFARLWLGIIHHEDIQAFSSQQKIAWKFIPELAPWMGGFYERKIGLVKTALKKAIHQRTLTMPELQTVLCEIQAILNSRPLLYNEVSLENDYLTPAHFLGRCTETLPVPSTEEEYVHHPVSADNLIQNWKRIQAMLDTFWKSWRSSYLQSLQNFHWKPRNRNASQRPPTVGTVVIVKDQPQRGKWKLGIITERIPSADGLIRSVVVRLSSGISIRRPMKLLFPLESCQDPIGLTSGITRLRPNPSVPPARVPSTRTAAVRAMSRIHATSAQGDNDDEE